MKWFNNPRSLEELKRQYKALCKKHHPDKGGRTSDMQEINAEFDRLFERLKNTHETADGKTYTKQENNETSSETAAMYREIINELMKLENIDVEIVGSWLWVTGDTYSAKENLKALGFHYAKSKRAWYYHADDYRKLSRRKYTLDQIRDLYGSEKIKSKPDLKLYIA